MWTLTSQTSSGLRFSSRRSRIAGTYWSITSWHYKYIYSQELTQIKGLELSIRYTAAEYYSLQQLASYSTITRTFSRFGYFFFQFVYEISFSVLQFISFQSILGQDIKLYLQNIMPLTGSSAATGSRSQWGQHWCHLTEFDCKEYAYQW